LVCLFLQKERMNKNVKNVESSRARDDLTEDEKDEEDK
jgi:hypothetical protein